MKQVQSTISTSIAKWMLGFALVAGMTACGENSVTPEQVKVATAAAPIAISATAPEAAKAVVATVLDKPIAFATGLPQFKTTTATTLTLSATTVTGAAAKFSIVEGTKKISGDFKIGSCIFVVTASDAPDVPVGTTIIVDPCSLSVQVAGQTADGTQKTTQANLVMGNVQSTALPIPVTVTSTGQIQVGGTTVANVNVTPPSGG